MMCIILSNCAVLRLHWWDTCHDRVKYIYFKLTEYTLSIVFCPCVLFVCHSTCTTLKLLATASFDFCLLWSDDQRRNQYYVQASHIQLERDLLQTHNRVSAQRYMDFSLSWIYSVAANTCGYLHVLMRYKPWASWSLRILTPSAVAVSQEMSVNNSLIAIMW